jgi:type VII secretion integral membrane protein EccD
VDLALPVTVPLADLLPAMLRMAGEELADAGSAHGGWALQRLGEPALDTAADLAELGLRDGETLHLRPRRAALQAADYDDVADAVDAALGHRSGRWSPAAARTCALSAAAALAAAGALVLLRSGPPWPVPAIAAGGAALALISAAGVLSRAWGDATAATVVAVAGLPYAFLAGTLLQAGAPHPDAFGAAQLLSGSGVLALAATLALTWVGDGTLPLLGAVVVALCGVLGGVADRWTTAAGAAAIVVTVLVVLAPVVPGAAYRAARLPLPFIPSTAEELRAEPDPVAAQKLLDRVVQADRIMTGLTAGAAIATAVGLAVEARGTGWAPPVLVLVAALALLLRARLFTGLHQRIWLLSGGTAGVVMAAVAVGNRAGGGAVGLVVVLLLAAALTVAVAMRPAGRRYAPFWPRLADIAELLVVATVVPIALQVLGVYGYVRSLWG